MTNRFLQEHVRAQVDERQRQAEAAILVGRLLTLRRAEKRARTAERQVHLARLAVHRC